MENNTSQNKSGSNSNNSNNDSNNSKKNQGQGQQDGGVLALFQPHDMSRTVESAMHVFQGRTDKLPELMQDIGQIVLKATRRFSTTQLIATAGALTIGAILLAKYGPVSDEFEEA